MMQQWLVHEFLWYLLLMDSVRQGSWFGGHCYSSHFALILFVVVISSSYLLSMLSSIFTGQLYSSVTMRPSEWLHPAVTSQPIILTDLHYVNVLNDRGTCVDLSCKENCKHEQICMCLISRASRKHPPVSKNPLWYYKRQKSLKW